MLRLRTVLLAALLSLPIWGAFLWGVRALHSRDQSQITQLRQRADSLVQALARTEAALAQLAAARAQAEAQLDTMHAHTARTVARSARVAAEAQAVLRDSTATLAQLRLSLVHTTEVIGALHAAYDSVVTGALTARQAAALERDQLTTALATAHAVIATQADVLRLTTPPCRIGPLSCPSRTTASMLTFVGTSVLLLLVL
jgi:chromosome segregation ATPase